MRIVFMGTPEFAVPSLEKLINNGYNVVAVVTAPDKPSGRGQQITKSAVKIFAEKHQLKIFQPVNLKDQVFIDELKSLKPDLNIVVAFRMLPQSVWSLPEFGSVNLHASLLPKYRGAAPINWAIINGEKETGVTTFFIQQQIDTGNIIFQEKILIDEKETAGTLHDKLMNSGSDLILKTVIAVEQGNCPSTAQNFDQTQPAAPKIFKENCRIKWNMNAREIYNFIRGLSPYPTAWTIFDNKILKIYSSEILNEPTSIIPGSIITDNKTFLRIAANDNILSIQELQLEGKKRMSIEEFIRGKEITVNQVL
jgi:methionyl-tRNA formyltransferase